MRSVAVRAGGVFAGYVHARRLGDAAYVLPASRVLVGVVEDTHIRFLGAEELLGAAESIAGGDVRVGGHGQEDVALALLAVGALLQGFEDAGAFQDFINVFGRAGDEEVKAVAPHEAGEILQRYDAGGVEVAGVLEAQDDDLDCGIRDDALDLGAEQFRRAEKQIALDMHDGDRGDGAGAFPFPFAQLADLVELVFREVRFAGFSEEKGDRDGDADEDGDVERGEQGGEESEDDDERVIAGGAQADADLAEVEERERDRDDQHGERGSGDVVDEVDPRFPRPCDEDYEDKGENSRENRSCFRRRAGVVVQGGACERAGGRHPARERGAEVRVADGEHVLVRVEAVAGLRGDGLCHHGVFQGGEESDGKGEAHEGRNVIENPGADQRGHGRDEFREAEGGEGCLPGEGTDIEMDQRAEDRRAENECDGERGPCFFPFPESQIDQQRDGADGERHPIGVCQRGDEFPHEAEKRRRFLRIHERAEAEQGLELVADDEHRRARHVADEHAARNVLEKIRDLEHRADDGAEGDQQHQQRQQLGDAVLHGGVDREKAEEHEGRRVGGAGDVEPGAGEKWCDDGRDSGAHHSVDHVKPGDGGVGDGLRQCEQRDVPRGADIRAELRAGVFPDRPDTGQETDFLRGEIPPDLAGGFFDELPGDHAFPSRLPQARPPEQVEAEQSAENIRCPEGDRGGGVALKALGDHCEKEIQHSDPEA